MGLFGGRKMEAEAPRMVTADLEERAPETPSLPAKTRSNTVIAEGVTFSGTINGEGVVQVEGIVEGQVDLKGSLIVTTTGLVKGPVHAETVHIAGTVKGDIRAKDRLRLERTGNVEGDVSTVSLVIEEGGCLNGRATMSKDADQGGKKNKQNKPQQESSAAEKAEA